ncbi:glycosyltransferase [Rodentibacter genomosp. 2]|uniref:RfaG protein n=1 Tax=Rodentibacter genomosp. 2 TaxID=1908266 RepID=A0A1V3JIE0_9PAST|nr:glycosyltransferase [Rodentibacter genomosp. 2]OOF56404.1 RfaG protein [Rodentibacter genomosp. 2]
MERENLRVLLVSDMGHIGGTEIATLIAATELMPLVESVQIFGKTGPLFERIEKLGVQQIDADCHTKNPFKLLDYIYKLVKTVNDNQIDVIHAQMARPLLFIWLAKTFFKNKQIKIFWTSRGLDHKTYQKVVPFFSKMDVRGLGNCKLEQQKLIRYGYLSEKTDYVYNAYRLTPTDNPMKSLDKESFTIGTLSALREGRSVELFLELAKYMLKNNADKQLRFVIGGDGNHRAVLENYAATLGIDRQVLFLGRITDVVTFMDNIDVFVSPLVVKGDTGAGLSNSIVEAMIMKVPVCAFRAAGIEEIVINNQTGHLLEPRDIPAMAEAVLKTIDEKSQTETQVNQAYDLIIRECDPKKYAQKLLCLYKEL